MTTSASGKVYAFSEAIDLIRDEKIKDFVIPDDFPEKNMTRFLSDTSSYMEFDNGKGGKGINFYELYQFVKQNEEVLAEQFAKNNIHPMGAVMYEDIQALLKEYNLDDTIRDLKGCYSDLKGCFLASHRSHQADVALVYSVIKDTYVCFSDVGTINRNFFYSPRPLIYLFVL